MRFKLNSGQWVNIDRSDMPLTTGWGLYIKRGRNASYVEMCKWNPSKNRQDRKLLHRVITNAKKGVMICHLNGDGLDNRRCNLAVGNHHKNGSSYRTKRAGSASRYRGVHLNNGRGKRWAVMFWDHGVVIYKGRFDSERRAAEVYDKEAKRRFGKFAHLNFPSFA